MTNHADGHPSDDPLPHQYGLGATGKGTLASAVAFLSAAYPAAAIPLAGAGAALQAVGERLNTLQEVRTSEVLAAASKESSLSAEEVVRELIERDDLVLLATEAIDAARRSRLPGKAATLGQSLGAILADDAVLDLESVWIRIVSVVEPPHIRILGLFLEHTGTMGTGSTLWGRKADPHTVEEVGERLGLGEAVLPLVQDLLAAGLLASAGVAGVHSGVPDAFGQSIHATTLGAQLFARLSQAGLVEPDDFN
ncbi:MULTISPECIES: hypothetical protein [Arthrobacter]|uniref:hypothetical protein n=1 Tax=Arthrobacter TaxID=1663 RepID=UPI000B4079AA|nr:hypothetical protein [Arthrobacter globiformis]